MKNKHLVISNPEPTKKSMRYKNFGIFWNSEEQEYYVYTPEEMEQPKAFRYPEISTATIQDAKDFIDSY